MRKGVRQLHLANIANMAYGYAKALRSAGAEADVLCYDLTHILSMPEWYEGDFDIRIENEWAPDFSNLEVSRLSIPDWYRRIRSQDFWITDPAVVGDRRLVDAEWTSTLVSEAARFGARWQLEQADVQAYALLADALAVNFFPKYDVIYGYAYGAVPALLAGAQHYVPVELGTLRDIVQVDNQLGRLLALAYRTAPHVVITNADSQKYAYELGLERFSYIPHPVDEDVFRPRAEEEVRALRQAWNTREHLLVAAARQSWSVKYNDRYIRAFGEVVKAGRTDTTLMISEWGPDIDRAKELIKELGIGEFVRWFDPLPEARLAQLFAAADMVLDQFGDFGTFGLIGPKAMACGTPCLLSFNEDFHQWCFDQTPPIVAAKLEGEIAAQIERLLGDPEELRRVGGASRKWVLDHHSKRIAVEKFSAIEQSVLQEPGATRAFSSLKRAALRTDLADAAREASDASAPAAEDAVPADLPAHKVAAGEGVPANTLVPSTPPKPLSFGMRLRRYLDRHDFSFNRTRKIQADLRHKGFLLTDLRHQLDASQASIREQSEGLDQVRSDVASQAERAVESVGLLQALNDSVSRQGERIEGLSAGVDEIRLLEQRIDALQEALGQLEEKHGRMSQSEARLASMVDAQLGDSLARFDEVGQQLDRLATADDLGQMQARLAQLEKAAGRLASTDEVNRLEARLQHVDKATSRLASLDALSRCDEKCAELEQAISRLSGLGEKVRADSQGVMAGLQQGLEAARSEQKAALNAQALSMESRIAQIMELHASLGSRLEQMASRSADAESVRGELGGISQQLASLGEQQAAARRSLDGLKADLDGSKADHKAALNAQAAAIEIRLADTLSLYSGLGSRLEQLASARMDFDTIRSDMKAMASQVESLVEQHALTLKLNETFKQGVQGAIGGYNELVSSVEALKKELGTLDRKAEEYSLGAAAGHDRLEQSARQGLAEVAQRLDQQASRVEQAEAQVSELAARLDSKAEVVANNAANTLMLINQQAQRLDEQAGRVDLAEAQVGELSTRLATAVEAAAGNASNALALINEQAQRLTRSEARSGELSATLASYAEMAGNNINNLLALVGENRVQDHDTIRVNRNDVLEHLVRSRLAFPLNFPAGSIRSPKPVKPQSVETVFGRLQKAAPLNWAIFKACFDEGTRSYETLPSCSCSTDAHKEAELFRAFLRPYLRGSILDIGCGPQPVPHYLADVPHGAISGIDPISEPADHPFQFVPGVGEYLPWADASFDVLVSGTTLDHYYLLDQGLESAFRVLRPGGHFIAWITEFADAGPYDPYAARLEKPYDSEHLFHINRSWFLPMMKEIGFQEVEIINFELPFNFLFMSFQKPLHTAAA